MEVFAEAALLCVAAVPAVRVLLKQPVRDEMRARPAFALAALVVLVLVMSVVALAWQHSDLSRRALVASVVAVVMLAVVRARPNYGRSRGLPPGSLGLAVSLDAITDEAFYARSAARWGPVFKMSQFHRPVICIADLPRGLELLHTEREALEQAQWGFNSLVPGGYVEFMNGELHARTRQTLGVGFHEAVLADCRSSILDLVRQQFARMAGPGANRHIDPERCVDRIAFASVLRMVLGVGVAGPRLEEMERLFAPLDRQLDAVLPTPQGVHEAFRLLTGKVRWLADRANLTTDELAARSVLSEVVRADAMQITDPTVLGNLVILVSNGRDTLRGFLRWLMKMSADNPGWVLQLRTLADETPHDASAIDDFATHFVQETLRTHGSTYVYRVVKRTCWLGPYRLTKGWLLRLCLRESHLRPEVFPDPTNFDPGRFARRSHDQTEFCPMGHGTHACPADPLVMEVARLFVRELALNYDVRTVADGKAEPRNRHWQFWRPSSQFRIAVSRRG